MWFGTLKERKALAAGRVGANRSFFVRVFFRAAERQPTYVIRRSAAEESQLEVRMSACGSLWPEKVEKRVAAVMMVGVGNGYTEHHGSMHSGF